MKRPDTLQVLTGIVVIIVIAIIGAAFYLLNSQYNSLLGLYAKQQHQLISNGITPAGPSTSQLQKTGPIGPSGATGLTGATGPRGDSGYPGATGAAGAAGAAGLPGSAGAAGLTGAAGGDGVSGVAGQAGAKGQPGTAGADGAPGAPGANGEDGTPIVSWTYVTSTGVHKQCVRDIPFNPQAPTYNCVIVLAP